MLKNFINPIFFCGNYKLLEIFIIGLIGAVPMAFVSLNVIVWLKESGIEIALITLFTFARLPTSLRFLWSPFIDNYTPSFPGKFGHRKKWFILCTLITSVLIFITSTISPQNFLKVVFVLCILITFVSSIYDINFDAYRIELFEPEKQAIGAAAAVLGYRAGIIILNFGGLSIISHTNSWPITIKVIALFFVVAIFILVVLVRNMDSPDDFQEAAHSSLAEIIYKPFQDFFRKKHAFLILTAIILYKGGESLSTVIILPYYLDIGFSKSQISDTIMICGFISSILGVCLGALIMYILSPLRGLIFSGMAQVGMIFALIWLKNHSMEMPALRLVVTTENICEGIASVALMSYLSTICNKKYLASQYALLISASGIFGNTVSAYSGKLVEMLNWDGFFTFAVIISLPSLIVLIYLDSKSSFK
jgi:PAT family beta-lactamase induction signal transducer AmpG